MFPILDFPVFSQVLEQVLDVTLSEKSPYICNSKSELSSVCDTREGHGLLAMKIVYHHAN